MRVAVIFIQDLKSNPIFPHSNKAVAVGAVSYYIDHFVKGRITRFTYGTPCSTPYKPTEPEHIKREHKVYTNVIGEKYISEAFRCMLSKVWR